MSAVTWTPKFEGVDNAGKPLPLGQLFTYEAGTTTPLASYTDQSGTTENTNPVILDAAGRANVWLAPNVLYKLVLKDKNGITIWTQDLFSVGDPAFPSILGQSSGASKIGYIPPGEGAVPTDIKGRLDQSPVRPQDFMTPDEQLAVYLKTGAVPVTGAVQRALDTGRPVEFPDGVYPCGPLTASGLRIFGAGTIRSSSSTAATALITMSGGSIEGVTIDSPSTTPALYGVLGRGEAPMVKGVTFAGNYGHCVYMSGCRNAKALDNLVKQGGSHIAVMVFENCDSFQAIGNTIEEHTGFGIQARFSGRGTVTGNSISQRYFMQSFTATATNETFTITPDRTCMRFSAFCNGAFRPITSATQVGTTNSYQVTVTGLTIGQPVAIYSFVGLECIQANSGCFDITITANTVGSSGDSGILCGADYHNTGTESAPVWVLDPDAAVEADYPGRVVIHSNTIRGPILAAGVAINNGVDCVATANTISNVGYSPLEAYKCGVSLGLVLGGMYHSNVVDGTNGHTLAALKFVGGLGMRRPPTIGRNRGIGCKSFEGFPMRSTAERSFGYDFVDVREDDTVTRDLDGLLESAWTGGNATRNNFTLATSGGTGVAKDSSVVYGHWTALRTIAGQVADFSLTPGTLQLFRNKIVRLSFFGKADNAGDSADVLLFYQFPGDDPSPPVVKTVVNTADWQAIEITMALGDMAALFFRISGTSGTTRICRIRMDMMDVEG